MKKSSTELLSVAGLLAAALLWGISYPLTKAVENCPTFYILPIRFIVASAVLSLFCIKRFKNFSKELLKWSFLLSFCITFMYIFATVGIKYTTSVRASFFTCLGFAIVPVLNAVLFKVRFTRITATSVLICLAGMFLLSYTPNMGSFMLNLGDILCILGATSGSLHIIFLDRISKEEYMDPMFFTLLLMLFTALWTFIISVITGAITFKEATLNQIWIIIFLGLFCSAAAFLLQTICQKYVPSNRVGIILAMEPASGCIVSVIALGETMVMTGWAGAFIIMFSLIYMEIATGRATAIAEKNS
ncbi:MAG: DMT family transporter [Anaerovoracaceae bacterium]